MAKHRYSVYSYGWPPEPAVIRFESPGARAALIDELRGFLVAAGFRAGASQEREDPVGGPGNRPVHWKSQVFQDAQGDVELSEESVAGEVYIGRKGDATAALVEVARLLALDTRFVDFTRQEPLATQLNHALIRIAAHLQRLGHWSAQPPAMPQDWSRHPFGEGALTFTQWLQWVFLPQARAAITNWELPADSMVGTKAVREFDGWDEAAELVSELGKFDDLIRQACELATATTPATVERATNVIGEPTLKISPVAAEEPEPTPSWAVPQYDAKGVPRPVRAGFGDLMGGPQALGVVELALPTVLSAFFDALIVHLDLPARLDPQDRANVCPVCRQPPDSRDPRCGRDADDVRAMRLHAQRWGRFPFLRQLRASGELNPHTLPKAVPELASVRNELDRHRGAILSLHHTEMPPPDSWLQADAAVLSQAFPAANGRPLIDALGDCFERATQLSCGIYLLPGAEPAPVEPAKPAPPPTAEAIGHGGTVEAAPWMKQVRTPKDYGDPEYHPVRAHYTKQGQPPPHRTFEGLGPPELLGAFFNTLSFHLEKDGWGTRFPALMRELYGGLLPASRVPVAAEELMLARREITQHQGVIWDYREPQLLPPNHGLASSTTPLDQIFQPPGCGGRSLFDLLSMAFSVWPDYDISLMTGDSPVVPDSGTVTPDSTSVRPLGPEPPSADTRAPDDKLPRRIGTNIDIVSTSRVEPAPRTQRTRPKAGSIRTRSAGVIAIALLVFAASASVFLLSNPRSGSGSGSQAYVEGSFDAGDEPFEAVTDNLGGPLRLGDLRRLAGSRLSAELVGRFAWRQAQLEVRAEQIQLVAWNCGEGKCPYITAMHLQMMHTRYHESGYDGSGTLSPQVAIQQQLAEGTVVHLPAQTFVLTMDPNEDPRTSSPQLCVTAADLGEHCFGSRFGDAGEGFGLDQSPGQDLACARLASPTAALDHFCHARLAELLPRISAPQKRNWLMFHAIRRGNLPALRSLLAAGVGAQAVDSDGRTPLLQAVAGDHPDMVVALLQAGANPDGVSAGGSADQDADTPLSLAFRNGSAQSLRVLLANGADPTAMHQGAPLMHLAVAYDMPEVMEELISQDSGPDIRASWGFQPTPLMVAARNGNLRAVEKLLELGADPSAVDGAGHTARDYAATHQQREVLERLKSAPGTCPLSGCSEAAE